MAEARLIEHRHHLRFALLENLLRLVQLLKKGRAFDGFFMRRRRGRRLHRSIQIDPEPLDPFITQHRDLPRIGYQHLIADAFIFNPPDLELMDKHPWPQLVDGDLFNHDISPKDRSW